VPLRVRAPLAVAVDACRIDREALTQQQASGSASCTAISATPALNRIVQPQLALDPAPRRP
jgi:hypothetical protein